MAILKKELAGRVNTRMGLKEQDLVELIIDTAFAEIEQAMYDGHEVRLPFGSFKAELKRGSFNPKTMKKVGPLWLPKFRFSSGTRRRIKSKRADYYGMKGDDRDGSGS